MSVDANHAARRRYEVLDSLRGICACMVVLYHFSFLLAGTMTSSDLVHHSFLFVDFFFVLSGFVIACSYRPKLAGGFPLRHFMGLRLGRIYPLHLAVLGLLLLTQLALLLTPGGAAHAFTGNFTLDKLAASIVLVHVFLAPAKVWWNGPSWSISAEIWTYLLFALLFIRLRPARLGWVCVVAVLACAATIGLTQPRYMDAERIGAFLRCVEGFAIGVLLVIAVCPVVRMPAHRGLATVLEAAVVLLVLAFVARAGAGPLSLLAPLVFAAAVLVFSFEAGALSALLRTRVATFVGALSYSIYMMHLFLEYRLTAALNAVAHHLQADTGSAIPPPLADALALAGLLVVIAASWCTFTLIEKPGQRWSRRLILRPGAARSPAEIEKQEAPAF